MYSSETFPICVSRINRCGEIPVSTLVLLWRFQVKIPSIIVKWGTSGVLYSMVNIGFAGMFNVKVYYYFYFGFLRNRKIVLVRKSSHALLFSMHYATAWV